MLQRVLLISHGADAQRIEGIEGADDRRRRGDADQRDLRADAVNIDGKYHVGAVVGDDEVAASATRDGERLASAEVGDLDKACSTHCFGQGRGATGVEARWRLLSTA